MRIGLYTYHDTWASALRFVDLRAVVATVRIKTTPQTNPSTHRCLDMPKQRIARRTKRALCECEKTKGRPGPRSLGTGPITGVVRRGISLERGVAAIGQ